MRDIQKLQRDFKTASILLLEKDSENFELKKLLSDSISKAELKKYCEYEIQTEDLEDYDRGMNNAFCLILDNFCKEPNEKSYFIKGAK